MHADGTTSQDQLCEGAPRPGERWRPRPVRDLDELLDDLLGAPPESPGPVLRPHPR